LSVDYQQTAHAMCNAHHLRELDGWARHQPDRCAWAATLAQVLRDAWQAVKTARAAGHDHLDDTVLTDLHTRWQAGIAAGDLACQTDQADPAGPPRKGGRQPIRALLNRMRGLDPEIWQFTRNFAVPFDNNQAERDIRMTKIQMKISGCWRTTANAEHWLRIRSYISTLTKHGQDVLTALRNALTGNPWLPPLPE
jgi:transposase